MLSRPDAPESPVRLSADPKVKASPAECSCQAQIERCLSGPLIDPYLPGSLADAYHAAEEPDPTPPDDTPRTLAQIPALGDALALAAAARFELAATALVAHATSHRGAPESAWALRRAHVYWLALGREADAAAARREYEAHHAMREPRIAAEFFWSHVVPDRRAHLRTYLAKHARRGPPELQVAAEAELAADLWHTACPEPSRGLCTDRFHAVSENLCSAGEALLSTSRPRDPVRRAEALRLATSALHRGEGLNRDHVPRWRQALLSEALGRAALVLAEDALETLLAIRYPRGLDFMVEDYKHGSGTPGWEQEYRHQRRKYIVSVHRFERYMTRYNRTFTIAMQRIRAIAALHDRPAILSAMVHTAFVFRELARDLEFADHTPKDRAIPGATPFCEPIHLVDALRTSSSKLLETCDTLVREAASEPIACATSSESKLYREPFEFFGPD